MFPILPTALISTYIDKAKGDNAYQALSPMREVATILTNGNGNAIRRSETLFFCMTLMLEIMIATIDCVRAS